MIDDFTRQAGRVDFRALEVLVPIRGIIDQPAFHIFLPERRAAIHTQPVKAEGIQRQSCRKLERRLHVLDGFIGIADRKKPVDDLDAGLFGIVHRLTHFFQRLLFFEPIQNLLAAALNAEHDGPAMGLGHRREEMLRDGIDPSFDAPLNRQVFLHHAIADRFNAFRLEQKVVVDKIDGAIPVGFEILELGDHMLRRCGPAICLR